jgi:hypothetical protein
MEKVFAPRVVRPPWARKSACKSSEMNASTTLAAGPRKIALMPVPAGWEVDPATGTGMGKQLNTKTAAPNIPRRGM